MPYDDLIKRLRISAEGLYSCDECNGECNGNCIFTEAADAIEDLIVALTASNEVIAKSKQQWIPVTERLPEDGVFVLVSNDDGIIMVAKHETDLFGWYKRYCPYDHDCWWENEDGKITHWMPLPESPESWGE